MMPQERLAAKSTELHGLVDDLLTIVSKAVAHQTPVHEVEREAFATLLRAGLATIQLLVDCLGDGDVGATHQLEDGRTLQRSAQPQGRPYVSIFGSVAIQRFVYAVRAGQKIEFAELDARLDLPEGKFSYLLQDWDQGFAMEQPFGKVSQTVERILGLRQHVDSLERMNQVMSEAVAAFHAAQTPPPADEEGAIFVETSDGKGVSIRRPADAAPIQHHRPQSGPKPDRKKMATLGAVYSVDPFLRTPEEVVEALFRDPQQEEEEAPPPARPRPCHKRLRAILNHVDAAGDEVHGRAAVFGWMTDELAARNVGARKPLVCIMDGEKALWEAIAVFQADVPRIEILDVLHVTPRLWTAAALFHPGDPDAAETFVRDRLLRILRGEVSSVLRGLRRMATTQGLTRPKRRDLEKLCAYLERNRDRMRYDEYLAAGYPIASGVIEGACRQVVKDRLERTGMNWVRQGAQAMLDLRCLYLTEQWDAFLEFRIARETQRLYPYRDTLKPLSWKVAA